MPARASSTSPRPSGKRDPAGHDEAEVGPPGSDLRHGIEPPLRDARQQDGILRRPQRAVLRVGEEHVHDDDPPAAGQVVHAPAEQPAAVGLVPVVEHVGEQMDVVPGGPDRAEHVAADDVDPRGEAGLGDGPPGDGGDGIGLEHAGPHVSRGLRAGDRIHARAAPDVEQPTSAAEFDRGGDRGGEDAAAAIHGGRERLGEGFGAHRRVPVGLPRRTRPVGRPVGPQHLQPVIDPGATGHARVIGTGVAGRSGHEKLPAEWRGAEAAVRIADDESVGGRKA